PAAPLVAVLSGRVDGAVAEPQRLLDHPGAGASAQIPSAETDRRNAGAIRLHIWYRHGRPLLLGFSDSVNHRLAINQSVHLIGHCPLQDPDSTLQYPDIGR